MTLTERAASVLAFSQHHIDRVAPPHSRQKAWDHGVDYANQRPLLVAFLLVQATLATLPLLFFVSFVFSTILFAIGAALLFILFWVGIAMLILAPALFITLILSIGIWAWGVATFLAVRWLYNLIPYNVKGGLTEDDGSGRKLVVHVTRDVDEGVADEKPPSTAAHTHPRPEAVAGGNTNGGDDGVL